MKILFVEDDPNTREVIATILNAHRYAVDVVADGEAGLEMALQWNYDLIILDLNLPKLHGIEVCRKLRARSGQPPILVLTTRAANEDIVAGLDAGADDYVTKSCNPDQLLARVRALLRRRHDTITSPVLTWGHLCLDPSSAQVTYNQAVVPCRPKEYTLLELFLRSPQRLLSRSSIIDHLWTFDDAPVEGSVTTLVKDLRRRLKAAGMEQDPIETVYGLGYRLKPTPVNSSAPPKEHPGYLEEAVSRSREDSKTQRLQMVLQNVRANFRASWAQRLTDLEQAEQAFQTGDFDPDLLQQALTHVHKLAGGLGTFGYGEASKIAEMLEQLLSAQISQQQEWIEQFSGLLLQLNHELANPPEPITPGLPLVEAGQKVK